MTIRDTEVIELLADKPELLAIADAVSATQRKPARSTRRRVAARAGLVGAVAAGVIVAVLAWPQANPPGGVVGRALAAIGDARIMHIVTESPSGIAYVDLKTGHRTAPVLREELWVDQQLDHFHLVMSLDGRLLGDLLLPQDQEKGTTGGSPADPAFVALWTGYRAALKNGTAKLVGRGHVLGHRVYWLAFTPTSAEPVRTEVAVDAHTYRPILNRTYVNGTHRDQRILVAKTIPYRAAEFERRGPSLFSGEGSGSSSSGAFQTGPSAPPPPTSVHAPFLTAGKTVAGLTLWSAEPLTVTSNFRGKRTTVTGIELVYGPVVHGGVGPLSTTVDELPKPDDPNNWRFIPAGSMRLETGQESSDKSGSHTLWTGTLRKKGIYITISTPKSERALIRIARALHAGHG